MTEVDFFFSSAILKLFAKLYYNIRNNVSLVELKTDLSLVFGRASVSRFPYAKLSYKIVLVY
jgi:hypothetical protein